MTRHYEDEVLAAVDGRLDAAGRRELDIHLAECRTCRASFEELRWVRQTLAVGQPAEEDPPPTLAARITAALDAEDRAGGVLAAAQMPRPAAARSVRWAPAALSIAAAAVVVIGLFVRSSRVAPTVVTTVARDFDSYRNGALPLSVATTNGPQLQTFLDTQHIGFAVRVLDLSMMGYRLSGGSVIVLDGHPAALIAYRADAASPVVCVMYLGEAAALTRGATLREHNGFTFYVHRMGGRTLVAWQEGTVTCVLVSDAEPEAVIRLAFEKAMRAA